MGVLTRQTTTNLDDQTLKNYQAAYRYYNQKQDNFKLFWNKKVKNVQEKINEQLEFKALDDINERWQNIYNSVINNFSISNNIITGIKTPSEKIIITNESDSTFVQGLIDKYKAEYNKKINNNEKTGVNLKSQLGFDYEEFITAQLRELLEDKAQELIQQTSQASIKTSGKGIRQGGVEIISDIVINTDKRKTNKTLSQALEVIYDVKAMESNNLQTYIKDNHYAAAAKVYGIAAKNWLSGKEGQKFTSASKVSEELNEKFKNSITQSGGPRAYSWNKNYAQSFANLHVSTRLIDLLGPANILVAMGNKFIWMSNFINDRFFYINLYADKIGQRSEDEILNITASKGGNIHIRKAGVKNFILNYIDSEDSTVINGLIVPIIPSLEIKEKPKS